MSTAFFDARLDFKLLIDELAHLDKLHQRVSADGWPADEQDAWILVTAMAASIEKCYSGAEKILKNLLQELDGSIPTSQDWHRQLIDRAASIGPHGRPALFGQELAKVFHDLRSFRHRERNSYVTHLDRGIVLEKGALVIKAVQSLGERLVQQSSSATETEAPIDAPKG